VRGSKKEGLPDARWRAGLERLAAANRAAARRRLRALTLEGALREFEQLVREFDEQFGALPRPKARPVALIRYLRNRKP
jgi:hypothetical protein